MRKYKKHLTHLIKTDEIKNKQTVTNNIKTEIKSVLEEYITESRGRRMGKWAGR